MFSSTSSIIVWSFWASVCTAPGSTPALPSGLGRTGLAFHIFFGIDNMRRVAIHPVQSGCQNARIGGEVMNHVNAAARQRVQGGGLVLVHRVRQILQQFAARACLVRKAGVNEVEHNKRYAAWRRTGLIGIGEFVRVPGTRPALRGGGDFLE
jgi:hypothetical protein